MATKKKVTKEKTTYDSSKTAEEQIISKLGKRITYLNADNSSSIKEWMFCGSYKLARAVSKGLGLPVGRLTTIIGKKSSGKSTLVAEIIKESQKQDALVVLFDTEYTFSEERANQLGIDCSRLMVSQPDTIEDLFDALESIVEIAKSSDRLIVIIWDSLASTPTRSEVAGTSGEGGAYGEHSKLVSAGLRKVMGTIAENRVLFVIINQVKVDLNAYGNADNTTYIAKLPLEFHSSVMIDIRQQAIDKDKDENAIGIFSKLRVIKNKVSAPFKEALIRIDFDRGIDTDWEALEIAKEEGRVLLDGSWTKIIKDCDDCRLEEIDEVTGEITYENTGKGQDGKECVSCEGKKWVGRPEFKFFYSSSVGEMYEKYPGLKEYFLYGTGPYEIKEN